MAREPAVTINVTPWRTVRAGLDQRLAIKLTGTRAANGEMTQMAKRANKLRESLREPTRSIMPTEPTAPAAGRSQAAPESRRDA
jgi:hypothetical protein